MVLVLRVGICDVAVSVGIVPGPDASTRCVWDTISAQNKHAKLMALAETPMRIVHLLGVPRQYIYATGAWAPFLERIKGINIVCEEKNE